jgi:hypothetical protein
MTVLEEIRKLDEKKAALLKQAKDEALANAKKAVAELNSLGYKYQLVTGNAPATSGGRRSGIRNDVLTKIKATPLGIARADLLDAMGIKGDKRGEQSVSNALSALKKAGTIGQNAQGAYVSA